ncbi:lysophospholipid acyltransferase family protein [Sulfurimonas sp.]|uniref:lysophospholipid acyltransferase family protein n=1 Tax=Sulfurimonas sp. TaxID=2022749 RepID=UPI003D0EFF66
MLKQIFFLFIVRPIILIIAGVNLQGKENLPFEGPCIIAANHNSHIDTMVLLSLFPISKIKRVRPVAAADYFLKNRFIAWFSKEIIEIIPLSRKAAKTQGHPLAEVIQALDNNEIVIIFPEGSRGESEELSSFKTGVAHLAKKFPNVPVIPVYIHGAGKCLPKGEALFVPFIIDVKLSEAIYFEDETNEAFTKKLEQKVILLKGNEL